MIHHCVKKISAELEKLAKYNISVERALDLMEASTEDLNELIAINTMREISQELKVKTKKSLFPQAFTFDRHPSEAFAYPA
jgi:hypothetical protein